MKRNVSQTAKIIGVDVSHVKLWSSLFREHLSANANPAKGVARVLRDVDVLALCYICSKWENDPDIEAIKIGLNLGDHREDEFVELLYLHTPLLQEPPDDLDETWRHGILLCGGGGRYEYLEHARNYRNVAESMLESALDKDELGTWAYAILFTYRHTLELYLKLIGEVDEFVHSLKRCVNLVEARHGKKIQPRIRKWILEFDDIDPAGTAFRYADEDLGFTGYVEYWFDFVHFQFAMKLIFDELDMAILQTGLTGKIPGKPR